MTPEEVLGVAPAAGRDQAHAAYRALVRRHHPDAHAGAPLAERARHAARFRQVTEAWQALAARPAPPAAPSEAEPVDEGDVDEIDDEPVTASGAGAMVTMLPMALLALALVTFAASVVLRLPALWAASFGLGALALGAFAFVPFIVMSSGRSRRR